MVRKRAQSKKKRFTVTLDTEAYDRLKKMVDNHDPPLSLNYAVQYAVKMLLARAKDRKAVFDFADPTHGKGE